MSYVIDETEHISDRNLAALNAPMREPIRISSRPRYYMKSDHFCQHCGAEHLDPVPPVEHLTWALRVRWMLQGAATLALFAWAWWGIIYR